MYEEKRGFIVIYVTGDTHNSIDLDSVISHSKNTRLNLDDKIIIAGDFGLLWGHERNNREQNLIDFWIARYPEVLWIDGNHENFDRIKELPTEERHGSDVGVVHPGIYHLRRGRVYTIDGLKFFTFGGGYSIDKLHRFEGISWWKEELPSFMESSNGLNVLEEHNNKVDYVITHTAPLSVFNAMCSLTNLRHKKNMEDRSLMEYFDHVSDTVDFKKWFFGHYHVDLVTHGGKYRCLYNDVVSINKED